MKKIFNLLFILLISWGLSGCIELYELIQLKADGTAVWTFRVSIPDFPDKKQKGKTGEDDVDEGMADIFSSINKKGLQLVEREEEVKYGLKIFSIKVAANQLEDINQIYKGMGEKKNKSGKKKKGKDELDQLYGGSPIKVKKNKDGSLKISRTFKPPKIKKKKAKEIDLENIVLASTKYDHGFAFDMNMFLLLQNF